MELLGDGQIIVAKAWKLSGWLVAGGVAGTHIASRVVVAYMGTEW